MGKKKKKKGSGEDRVKVNVSTVESKKKEHLQTLMQAIGDYITVDHIGDIAASEDKNIGDEEVESIVSRLKDDFSDEKIEKLINDVVEKAKEDSGKEEISSKEVEDLLEKSVSVEYLKSVIDKRAVQLLNGESNENKSELSEEEKLRKERDEYLELARRVQADFENFRKRTIRENEKFKKLATVSLIEKLLPVIDGLDGAIASSKDIGEKALEGFKKIRKLLMNVLSKEGLEEIEAVGQPFDPDFHEAMMQEESDEVEVETVTEELRKGYKIGEHIIRASMVKVAIPTAAKKSGDESEDKDGDDEE